MKDIYPVAESNNDAHIEREDMLYNLLTSDMGGNSKMAFVVSLFMDKM
jgi:hypothetical protein